MSENMLPHELEVARKNLLEILDKSSEEFAASGKQRFSHPQEVGLAIDRFVNEFRRIESGSTELKSRDSFVAVETGQRTEYAKLMAAAFACLDKQRPKPAGKKLTGAKLAIKRLKPAGSLEFVDQLSSFIGDVKRALDEEIIPIRCRIKFRDLLIECERIWHEAQRIEADGCRHLLECADQGLARGFLETGRKMGGVYLGSMRAAVDSLAAWAARLETQSPGVPDGEKKKPGRRGRTKDKKRDELHIYRNWQSSELDLATFAWERYRMTKLEMRKLINRVQKQISRANSGGSENVESTDN